MRPPAAHTHEPHFPSPAASSSFPSSLPHPTFIGVCLTREVGDPSMPFVQAIWCFLAHGARCTSPGDEFAAAFSHFTAFLFSHHLSSCKLACAFAPFSSTLLE
eukprot:GGOE01007468.1.p5 GENE.GGOE01007468.1~~GGOE01007468.1.p5  ORF type:complete len:103 (+),score=3.63 GGOE01007468.1:639-947(+)